MKIKEIIVVEGKDDTTAIKKSINADTIETNGSAINFRTIEMIRRAKETRGVIVFTDPDYPGEKIRKTIAEQVPGCKHAFLPKEKAIAKKGRGLGVEHASIEDIVQALKDAHLMSEEAHEEITREDLLHTGLIAGQGARQRRERIGNILKIGYANGKQLHHRLKIFQITREEFSEAIVKMRQEDDE